GDDIYSEYKTFDKCNGHPENSGQYHYHTEPNAITNDDNQFVGMMRDGYPIFGRREHDGSVATGLDVAGGHTGAAPDTGTGSIYHYHVNQQSNDAGSSQWFITTGTWRGTPGATCTGC